MEGVKLENEVLGEELKGSKGKFHYLKTDLLKENQIVSAFEKINKDFGSVDFLINNAGIGIPTLAKDCEMDKWETMFKLNVFAVGICSCEAVKYMKQNGGDAGHIIIVSSIAVHRIGDYTGTGVYSTTKAAVKMVTEAIHRELVNDMSKIKITHLSPGAIKTEFLGSGGWQNLNFDNMPNIEPEQIAKAVYYILDTPPDTQVLGEELKGSKGKFHYLKTDLLKENQIVSAFEKINKDFGSVDFLINNAGIGIPTLAKDCEMDKWETMFKLNVFAVGICSCEAIKYMKQNGVDAGHIIIVSSIAVHRIGGYTGTGVYSTMKAAVKMVTEAIRRELVNDMSKIKITHLSPGAIKTEFLGSGGWQNLNFDNMPNIEPEQIAKAVYYILDTPPDTQVNELIIQAVGEGL